MSCNESPRTIKQVRRLSKPVQKAAHKHAARALLGVASVILTLSAGCDTQSEERAEGRDLLLRLNAIDDQHTLAERSAALSALAHLRLNSAEHVRTRDACHAAQLGLLQAETLQASARKALAQGSAQPGGSLSAQDAQSISDAIARSNQALADAKARFPACERATRQLLAKTH